MKTHKRPCPREIRIVAFLLVVQAAGLIAIGLVHVVATYAVPWISPGTISNWLALSPVDLLWLWERLLEIGKQSSHAIVLFLPLGVLAFASALGLRLRRHAAWTAAMATQGFHLLIALFIYFTIRPRYASGLMAWGVLMVIYLNYSEVSNAFRSRQAQPWEVEGES